MSSTASFEVYFIISFFLSLNFLLIFFLLSYAESFIFEVIFLSVGHVPNLKFDIFEIKSSQLFVFICSKFSISFFNTLEYFSNSKFVSNSSTKFCKLSLVSSIYSK